MKHRKPRTVHHSNFSAKNKTWTSCGKKSRGHISKTTILNDVTCSHCIEELKKSHWLCPGCGFIDGACVTNDERCELCGSLINEAIND